MDEARQGEAGQVRFGDKDHWGRKRDAEKHHSRFRRVVDASQDGLRGCVQFTLARAIHAAVELGTVVDVSRRYRAGDVL